MNTYNIEIVETLSKMIEIQAENEEQARELVKEMYRNEEIILIDENVSVKFNII